MKTVSFVRRKFSAMLGIATVSMAVNFIVMLSGSLVAARDRIADFLREGGVDDDIVHRVMYSVEENGLAAIEKNSGVSPCVEYFVSLAKPDFVRLIVRDDGIAMETPFRAFSEIRYLNTLNCNRTEHWFGRHEIRGDSTRRV